MRYRCLFQVVTEKHSDCQSQCDLIHGIVWRCGSTSHYWVDGTILEHGCPSSDRSDFICCHDCYLVIVASDWQASGVSSDQQFMPLAGNGSSILPHMCQDTGHPSMFKQHVLLLQSQPRLLVGVRRLPHNDQQPSDGDGTLPLRHQVYKTWSATYFTTFTATSHCRIFVAASLSDQDSVIQSTPAVQHHLLVNLVVPAFP